MIKLFWNTQNQKNDPNNKEDRALIWGKYHSDYSKEWIYEILNKIQYEKIANEKDIESGDILIIVDSSVEQKSQLYEKLQLVCSKMFLIHLGDEHGTYNLESVYNNFIYVWRTFCSSKYFNNDKIRCFGIGYKSGIIPVKEISKRKYKWAFMGTPHKSSRHDLLFQLSSIKPSFSHKTKKFNEGILNSKEMNEILASTEFVPCPNGFVHPETYRLYEALESGCIPIVENAYKYYDRLYPHNPFLKIDKWEEAKSIILKWDSKKIEKKQEECKLWWNQYKNELQEFIKKKLSDE